MCSKETGNLDFLTITGNHTYIPPLVLFFLFNIKVIEEEQTLSLFDKPFPAPLHSAGYKEE